jgi:hypothetical protein
VGIWWCGTDTRTRTDTWDDLVDTLGVWVFKEVSSCVDAESVTGSVAIVTSAIGGSGLEELELDWLRIMTLLSFAVLFAVVVITCDVCS